MTGTNRPASILSLSSVTNACPLPRFARGTTTRPFPVTFDQSRNSRFCDQGPRSVVAKTPPGLSHRRHRPDAQLSHRVQHEVEAAAELVECVGGVVDRQVGSQRSGQSEVAACHDRGNLGAAILGELKRCRADRAGCAVDQDPVAGFQGEMLDGRICVEGAFADDRLIEAQIRGHVRDRPGFGHAEVFRLGAVIPGPAHSEDAVSGLEQAEPPRPRLRRFRRNPCRGCFAAIAAAPVSSRMSVG